MKGKKVVMALLCLACGFSAGAEEKKCDVEASIGADVVSSYIWRGQKNGGVSIQPAASIGWKGLSLGAWGSFALSPTQNGTDEEIDLVLGYETKGFHVAVTDYFLFNQGHPFFRYGGLDESAHTFEANVGYDFGFLSVNWFTNFAGNDGLTASGKRAFSSYVQLDAPFKLAHLDWNATLGVVPYRTDFYADDNSTGFHVNTVALQAGYEFKVRKVTFPVSAQVIANPSSKGFYFVVGGGFKL